MIAKLQGKIALIGLNWIIVETQGGISYKVFVMPLFASSLRLNAETNLWTYLAVRENSMDLYGFTERKELDFFELLLVVPGVGPKSSLSILTIAGVETIKKAVATGDTSYLTKVSGIGKKSAEKIVLELKDKIGVVESDAQGLREEGQALDALQSLGYSLAEAREALKSVSGDTKDLSEKIREALKFLSS